MERVELLTELEQRIGMKVPQKVAAGDLHRAPARRRACRRPAAHDAADPSRAELQSWAVLLRDLPPETDPVLSGLLERRPIAAPLMHLLARAIRAPLVAASS